VAQRRLQRRRRRWRRRGQDGSTTANRELTAGVLVASIACPAPARRGPGDPYELRNRPV